MHGTFFIIFSLFFILYIFLIIKKIYRSIFIFYCISVFAETYLPYILVGYTASAKAEQDTTAYNRRNIGFSYKFFHFFSLLQGV